MKFRELTSVVVALSIIFGSIGQALACTSFQLISADGSRVYGRTMEFGFQLHSDLLVIPKDTQFVGTGPNNTKGATWKSKYGAVGLNGFNQTVLLDGMNEKGMTGGVLYFPGYASYTPVANADPKKTVAPWEFLTWALTNFDNVADVKEALKDIEVVAVQQAELKSVPPLHYVLHDAKGGVLVVEPINGKLVATDNPYGVMTNSPPFDWHVMNLSNYVKLSPAQPTAIKLFGQTVNSTGFGAGFLGMPGDGTPPSRFIRALAYSSTMVPAKNADENVRLAEHLLHNFDIPLGSVRESDSLNSYMEFTQWSTIGDIDNKRFYFSTYDYQPMRVIDLKAINFNKPGVVKIEIDQKYQVEKIAL
jgi:choloylglycine hydrolase